MVCTWARFVIHYKNGFTLIELDRYDVEFWKTLFKYIYVCQKCGLSTNIIYGSKTPCCNADFNRINMVKAIGVIFDPVVLWDEIWERVYDGTPMGQRAGIYGRDGRHVQLPSIQHTMIGSDVKNYFFWMEKMYIRDIIGKRRSVKAKDTGFRLGKVTSPQGHCSVVETTPDYQIREYDTTVFSLKLNLEKLDIGYGIIGTNADAHVWEESGARIESGI